MEEKLVREKSGGGVKTAKNKKSEESITSFGEMRQATFVPLRNSFVCMTHYKEINQFWAIQRQVLTYGLLSLECAEQWTELCAPQGTQRIPTQRPRHRMQTRVGKSLKLGREPIDISHA